MNTNSSHYWCSGNPADRSPLRSQAGFTLIELMLAIVIGGVLLAAAGPSFQNMIQNNRITAQTNSFVSAMNFARSEAIKRGANMDVIASDGTDGADEWGPGWVVAINGGDTIRIFEELDGSSTLNSDNDVVSFQYGSNGRVNTADTLTLCDGRDGETGRQITIATTGRVSSASFDCI